MKRVFTTRGYFKYYESLDMVSLNVDLLNYRLSFLGSVSVSSKNLSEIAQFCQ